MSDAQKHVPTPPVFNWSKPMTSEQAAAYYMTRGFVPREWVDAALRRKSNLHDELVEALAALVHEYDMLNPELCPNSVKARAVLAKLEKEGS